MEPGIREMLCSKLQPEWCVSEAPLLQADSCGRGFHGPLMRKRVPVARWELGVAAQENGFLLPDLNVDEFVESPIRKIMLQPPV